MAQNLLNPSTSGQNTYRGGAICLPFETERRRRVEMRQENKRVYKVYTIIEKPGADKGIWLEIGVANENRDGSLSAKPGALPVSGTLHIREFEKKNPKPIHTETGRRNAAKWRP